MISMIWWWLMIVRKTQSSTTYMFLFEVLKVDFPFPPDVPCRIWCSCSMEVLCQRFVGSFSMQGHLLSTWWAAKKSCENVRASPVFKAWSKISMKRCHVAVDLPGIETPKISSNFQPSPQFFSSFARRFPWGFRLGVLGGKMSSRLTGKSLDPVYPPRPWYIPASLHCCYLWNPSTWLLLLAFEVLLQHWQIDFQPVKPKPKLPNSCHLK